MKGKLIFTLILAFIGMYVVGTLIHENIHRYDLKDVAQNGSICLIDTSFNGDYDFYIPVQFIPQYKSNEWKYELRAYGVEGLFEMVCVYVFVSLWFDIYYGNKKIRKKQR